MKRVLNDLLQSYVDNKTYHSFILRLNFYSVIFRSVDSRFRLQTVSRIGGVMNRTAALQSVVLDTWTGAVLALPQFCDLIMACVNIHILWEVCAHDQELVLVNVDKIVRFL